MRPHCISSVKLWQQSGISIAFPHHGGTCFGSLTTQSSCVTQTTASYPWHLQPAPSGSVGIWEIYLCRGSARPEDQGLLNSSLKKDGWQSRSKPVHRLGPSDCIMLPISHGDLSECPSKYPYVAHVCMCMRVRMRVCARLCLWLRAQALYP